MIYRRRCKLLCLELQRAMNWHDEAYPDNDWKLANKKIGRIVRLTDVCIRKVNKWPEKRFIGNCDRVRILANL